MKKTKFFLSHLALKGFAFALIGSPTGDHERSE